MDAATVYKPVVQVIEACQCTPGGYGNCSGCWFTELCPTYQDTGDGRVYVLDTDTLLVMDIR